MRRRKYAFDEAKIAKYLNEDRGVGEGELYEPWLKVYDLPSRGRSHRVFGIKTRRIHHFLSDGEWKCFLRFEADETVTDIREQYPLDRIQTLRIANELGYDHPTTIDGTPYVLTIDFLITRIVSDVPRLEGYSFKYQPNRLTERDRELHHIAEEYLRRTGIGFHIIDETRFNENFIKNYDSIRLWFDLPSDGRFTRDWLRAIAHALLERLGASHTLLQVCRELAVRFGTASPQDVFDVVRHLLARGVLRADLSRVKDVAALRMHDMCLANELIQKW